MDNLKEAFSKIKQDIDVLRDELNLLKEEFSKSKEIIFEIYDLLEDINSKRFSTDVLKTSTDSFDISTHTGYFKPLNDQILSISTGNKGVPTDRQTNRQTDIQHENISKNDQFEDAIKILDSLDNLKKELRLKFKRLTDQEMVIFSTLYQLEEEFGFSDYKTLAERTNLTESSIRDYIGRLIKKGIPIEKNKVNNKAINLNIGVDLRKIATLSTILQLRNL